MLPRMDDNSFAWIGRDCSSMCNMRRDRVRIFSNLAAIGDAVRNRLWSTIPQNGRDCVGGVNMLFFQFNLKPRKTITVRVRRVSK